MEPDQCVVCPCCKSKVIHHVENTEPDSSGEYKAVWHCESCDSLWYLVAEGREQTNGQEDNC